MLTKAPPRTKEISETAGAGLSRRSKLTNYGRSHTEYECVFFYERRVGMSTGHAHGGLGSPEPRPDPRDRNFTLATARYLFDIAGTISLDRLGAACARLELDLNTEQVVLWSCAPRPCTLALQAASDPPGPGPPAPRRRGARRVRRAETGHGLPGRASSCRACR